MGRVSDYPWQHNCPSKKDTWPCLVMSRPASDHRIYVCGTEEFIMSDFTTRMYYPRIERTTEATVTYSNKYETPIQEAERKIQEAKSALVQAHEELQKAKRKTRFGVEPSNGSILKFEKKYNRNDSKSYYFAAIRVGGLWYLTSSSAYITSSPMSWAQLKTFIGDSKVWVPRNYDQMPSA